MIPTANQAIQVAAIGIGGTALMDLWLLLLRRLGVPGQDFALIGRWVGHLARGRWFHPAIARSQPIPHERTLGWLTHYATGIAFAGLLVAVCGPDWLQSPSPGPALAWGVATVAAPFLLMQPAMGAGIAASRTATPGKNRLRSAANHAVFGAGLYLTALALAALSF